MQEKAGLRFGESHPSKEGVGQEIAAVHQGPRVNPAEESRLRFTFNQHEMINKEVLREMVLTYYKRHREEAKLFHSLVYTALYYLAVVCIFITRIQHPAEERASDSEILIRVG